MFKHGKIIFKKLLSAVELLVTFVILLLYLNDTLSLSIVF